LTIVAAVLVFGALVLVHELGHFLVAKRVGIRVDEFALGFGPVLAGFTRGETRYSLRLLPIGGFVRMAGTTPEDKDDERGFGRRTVGQRMAVILSGSVMNMALAVLVFTLVFGCYGTARVDGTAIGEVLPGWPAERGGLRTGDRILSVDGQSVKAWNELVDRIKASPGKPLVLNVSRGEGTLTVTVVPDENPQAAGKGFLGVGPRIVRERKSVPAAVAAGVAETGRMIVLWFGGLSSAIFHGQAADVAGPVGITQMIGAASRSGLMSLLFLAAALSANLGLLNLLPIPALDGSRFLFLLYERIAGRAVDQERENLIHFLGFAFLLLLMVAVTYRDIARLLQPGS
jgi:regulator of sigma E protease